MTVLFFGHMFENLDILVLFFEEPNRSFNVREVARILKKSPSTISKYLKELKNKNILKEYKERTFLFYKANLESELYKDMKVFYNIFRIKSSGLIDSLNKQYFKPTIILFGSSAKGYDNKNSDIDLAIFSEKKSDFKSIKKYERILKRKIHILLYKDFKEIKNKHLANNILNGIILQGRINFFD